MATNTTTLKQAIEETLATAINDFAGANGSAVDADLLQRQLLQKVGVGFLLLPEDKKRGPVVRLDIANMTKTTDEIGNGTVRSLIGSALIRIAGMSRYNRDLLQTIRDRDRIEEVIRLNLLRTTLDGVISNSNDNTAISYGAILNWRNSQYYQEVAQGEQAALINSPVAASANTSTGTISINPASGYTGDKEQDYTIQIVTGNSTPGSLTGLVWKWKRGNEPYSANVAVNAGNFQTLTDGIAVRFSLTTGQSFVAGDRYTITASPTGLDYVGIFYQEWEMIFEALSG